MKRFSVFLIVVGAGGVFLGIMLGGLADSRSDPTIGDYIYYAATLGMFLLGLFLIGRKSK